MPITKKHSHIYAEEYLLIHHSSEYNALISIIDGIKIGNYVTDDEQINLGALGLHLKEVFQSQGWDEDKPKFDTSANSDFEKKLGLHKNDPKKSLMQNTSYIHSPYDHYTGFIKNKIAIEFQLSKYSTFINELFARHLSYYNEQIINIGVQIFPTKEAQGLMPSGQSSFEDEVTNVLNKGRTNPLVPLLFLGVKP